MARIHTSHKNASDNINGIKFTRDQHGSISEEVPLERAAMFEDMAGFKVIPSPSDAKPEPAPANMVTLTGPKGKLQVGGDYSPEDVEALRAQWQYGQLTGPPAELVSLHGPKGTLLLAGDHEPSDVAALREHWQTGSIKAPAQLAAPTPDGPSEPLTDPAAAAEAAEAANAAALSGQSVRTGRKPAGAA